MTDEPRRGPLQFPPAWLILFGAAAWLIGRVFPHGFPGGRLLGWVLVVVGLILMAWAALTMLRARASVDPTRRPTDLVTHGIYALSRNPIYLGDAVLLAGLCLIWAPLSVFLLVPGFMAVITRRFIAREEGWLRERDPAAYAAWAATTRRWL